MKKDIHPKFNQAKVKCQCGNKFVVGSTLEEIKVEVCSKCHPFFTGKTNLIDTEGRVDKFKAKLVKAAEMKETKKKKVATKGKKVKKTTDLRSIAKKA